MAPGGITEVDYNENKLFFDFLAGFSVEEYNKKQNSLPLELVKVVGAKEQKVAGTIYYIALEAKDRTNNKNTYEAKVFVALNFSLQLLEFKDLLEAASST